MKCKWCENKAYAWRTTRYGRDTVCRKCVQDYPMEGLFEPFQPWEPQPQNNVEAETHPPTAKG